MFTRKAAILAVPVGLASITTGVLLLKRTHPPVPTPKIMRSVAVENRTRLDTQRTFGTPHVYQNLTVLPVYDASAVPSDAYITLDEGLKAKTVKVQESTNGGDVNTLYVTNTSQKPLYLMAGEVVLGGQQDRTLGKDLIIAAQKRRVPITVFCVEHGRWTGRADFDASAQSVASADIRLGAQDGDFKAERRVAVAMERAGAMGSRSVGGPMAGNAGMNAYGVQGTPPIVERQTVIINGNANINNNVAANRPMQTNAALDTRSLPRQTAAPALRAQIEEPVDTAGSISAGEEVGKAQQQVWDKVETKNARFKTTSGTGTYRTALNMSGGDMSRSAPAYVNALKASLGQDPHLVGVVAVVNGKIVAADIFGDPILFQKLWPKLLRSYAADAVEQTYTGKPQAVSVTPAQVTEFYNRAVNGTSRAENKAEASANVRLESPEATTYRLMPAPSEKAAGSFGASKPLHETVLHK